MLSKTVVLINLHCLSQPEISLNPRLQLTYNPRLQRFQVVVKSHPLGKNSSPQFNFVLLPSRFGKNHNRSLSYYGSWIRLLTLHFSNITFFSTQNSLLITSCLKAVKWRNVLENLRGGCYGAMYSSKKPKVECILYLSRNMMSKMWDEDRENIVECRYGQLSSTEKIIIIIKESKQTRSNTKQNNWPCKCRAAVNRKFCWNVYIFAFRESSFNMTRGGGDEDIEGGLQKFLDTRRGGSEKIVALGGGLRKFVYFKTNTWHHHTDRLVFNSTI